MDESANQERTAQDVGDARQFGRMRQELLRTNYGPVIDLSAGGARIQTRWPVLSRNLMLKIYGNSGGMIIMRAEVVWRKRIGLFKQEIGLHFIDCDERMASHLTDFARDNSYARTVDSIAK